MSSAVAEKRIALVIGNNVYRNLSDHEQLQNAVSDAEAVKAALELLQFKVDLGENLDRAALVGKLSDFGARLEKGDIAFFFYAGHGVSFSGANYILPSDIPAPTLQGVAEEERLADLAVAETRVVDRIHDAGARIAVVVLDACRDNPLAMSHGRSIGGERGLALPALTNGVLSIYSAGVGQKALDTLDDDGDPNSVFTRVFVKELKVPGIGLRDMAFKTQSEVAKLASAKGYDQVPGVYSQIIDDFYLTAPLESTPPLAPQPTPAVDLEQGDFAAAMQSGSIVMLNSFLSKYPASALAGIVRREKERLLKPYLGPLATSPPPIQLDGPLASDEVAWEKAKSHRTSNSLRNFIREFPNSKRRHDAEILLANVGPASVERSKPLPTVSPSISKTPPAKRQHPRSPARLAAPDVESTRTAPATKCFAFNGAHYCE